jgi:TonB family protein
MSNDMQNYIENKASLLERVEIASPCSVSWESMTGDERARACQLCNLTVYNISQMSRPEAEIFLRERIPEQRLCLRLYRRKDGTIITDDCPRSLRMARDFSLKMKRSVVAALAIFAAWLIQAANAQNEKDTCASGKKFENSATDKSVALPDASTFSLNAILQNVGTFMQNTFAPPKHEMGEPRNLEYKSYSSKLELKIKSAWHHKAAKSEKAPAVSFVLDKNGRPFSILVVSSSGNPEVDKKAVNTIKGLVFESQPAELENSTWVFTLEPAQ